MLIIVRSFRTIRPNIIGPAAVYPLVLSCGIIGQGIMFAFIQSKGLQSLMILDCMSLSQLTMPGKETPSEKDTCATLQCLQYHSHLHNSLHPNRPRFRDGHSGTAAQAFPSPVEVHHSNLFSDNILWVAGHLPCHSFDSSSQLLLRHSLLAYQAMEHCRLRAVDQHNRRRSADRRTHLLQTVKDHCDAT